MSTPKVHLATLDIENLDKEQRAISDKLNALNENELCVDVGYAYPFGHFVKLHSAIQERLAEGQQCEGVVVCLVKTGGRQVLPQIYLSHQIYLRKIQKLIIEDPSLLGIEVIPILKESTIRVWDRNIF